MEILRYLLVFFGVGWGGGLLAGILFILSLPLISRMRGTSLGRVTVGAENGAATFAAVVLANQACLAWTDGPPSYAMYGLAFFAMVSNDLWRLRRALEADRLPLFGEVSPEDRRGAVFTERANLIGDFVGYCAGIAFVPRLGLF